MTPAAQGLALLAALALISMIGISVVVVFIVRKREAKLESHWVEFAADKNLNHTRNQINGMQAYGPRISGLVTSGYPVEFWVERRGNPDTLYTFGCIELATLPPKLHLDQTIVRPAGDAEFEQAFLAAVTGEEPNALNNVQLQRALKVIFLKPGVTVKNQRIFYRVFGFADRQELENIMRELEEMAVMADSSIIRMEG